MSIVIPNPPGTGSGPTSGFELEVQKNLTRAFILKLPVVLTLTPRSRVKKPGGGFAWVDGTPRAAQTFTLIEQGTIGGQPSPNFTQDGVERIVEFELLGEWTAQLARDDVFTYQDKDWEIIDLFYDNGYERRALVSSRG